MGKIDELESRIIKQGMSDDDFEEYKKLLKRVRSNFGKRQHYYTTAIQFPTKNANQPIRLIEYGLEAFPDDWFSTYTSYLYIGKVYESSRNYQKAYDSYMMALNALGEMGKGYKEELFKLLLPYIITKRMLQKKHTNRLQQYILQVMWEDCITFWLDTNIKRR